MKMNGLGQTSFLGGRGQRAWHAMKVRVVNLGDPIVSP